MGARTLNRLSALQAARLKTPGRHTDGGGLYLFIDESGRRRWIFMYVRRGKRVELGLGSGRDLPLAVVRTEAASIRVTLAEGGDPKAERAKQTVIPTFRGFRQRLCGSHVPVVAQSETCRAVEDDAHQICRSNP